MRKTGYQYIGYTSDLSHLSHTWQRALKLTAWKPREEKHVGDKPSKYGQRDTPPCMGSRKNEEHAGAYTPLKEV